MIDGKEEGEYKKIEGGVEFSADGGRYGYIAQKSNYKYVAVIDGKEEEEYKSIEGGVKFSADGKRYGYIAVKNNDRYIVVIDGKESEEYNTIGCGRMGFDYSVENNKVTIKITMNGRIVQETTKVTDDIDTNVDTNTKIESEPLVFSVSGNRYGYVARKARKGNGKCVAVIDGKESKEYRTISGITVSDFRYGFVVDGEKGWKVVVDGDESKEYDEIRLDDGRWYSWSSDYKLLGFMGKKVMGGGEYVCEIGINNFLRPANCKTILYPSKGGFKYIEFTNNKIYSINCRVK